MVGPGAPSARSSWPVAALVLWLAASAAGAQAGLRGVLAIRGGTVIAQEHADRLLAPASVTKLLVVAAALDALGPDHRVETTVSTSSPLRQGVLAGDLVLHAAGDPTWNARFAPEDGQHVLDALARQVAAAGIRRVTGDLVIDLRRFPGRAQPVSRPLGELAYGWAAPVSGVAIDENTLAVRIAPGPHVGAAGVVDARGARWIGPLINAVRTVSRERHEKGTFDVLPSWRDGGLLLRGEYPISEPPYRLTLSAPDPELRVARALVEALAVHGVEIEGRSRLTYVASGDPAADARVVARYASPPLSRWLSPILRDSHNWYAEMLLRQLAYVRHGEGRLDEGLTLVRRFLEETVGVDADSFVLDDGSGLSAENLITARTVTAVLAYAWRRPWREPWRAALATNGQGTLASWVGLPPLLAKTGTRRHTQALAGYLDVPTGVPIVFAVLLDHRNQSKAALRGEIGGLLTAWTRRGSRALSKEERP